MEILERVLTAAKHEEPDKVPIVLYPTARNLRCYAGVTTREYHQNLKVQLEAQVAFQRRFPEIMGVCIGIPDTPQCNLAAIFGGKFEWVGGDNAVIWATDYPIKTVEDIDRLLSSGFPDVEEAYADYLEGLRYFYDWFPNDLREKYGYVDCNLQRAPSSHVEGAVTSMMGYDKFFIWMRLYPKELHRFLRLFTDWQLDLHKAVSDIVGPPKLYLTCDHLPSMMGKEQFREFLLPYLNKFLGRYKGALRIYHNEGKCSHMLEEIDKIDAEVWQFGALDDPALCKEKTHFCLMGNLHPPGVFLRGTPKEVEEATKEIILKAGEGGGLWLSSGGGMAPNTPFRNIEAVIHAVEKYGKYPLKGAK